jgi:hypothetical protein
MARTVIVTLLVLLDDVGDPLMYPGSPRISDRLLEI